MKKWFWALLAVWMIAGSFSVTIRADRVVGNENGDISDGAGDIPNASGSSSEIKVMVSDVASRYAVDVTFPQLTVVFGEVVWNVDDCRYEIEENDPGINRFDIQVTNHSDRPSLIYGDFQKTSVSDGIAVVCDASSARKLRIPAVAPEAAAPQSMTIGVLAVPETGKTWSDVLVRLLSGKTENAGYSYTIGTLSVFVEAAP